MLKKHIDVAIVGKSYLSVLLSLGLLDEGKEVLLLDDSRVSLGDIYVRRIFLMEQYYLKACGEGRSVKPFVELQNYVKVSPTTFVFDGVRVRLGESPARNYRELVRKLPHIISSKDDSCRVPPPPSTEQEIEAFDRQYDNYCRRLGERAYKMKGTTTIGLDVWLEDCPKFLSELYKCGKAVLDSSPEASYWQSRTFLYMAQGLLQKHLSSEISDVELFHIFVCLLSPHYKIDQEKLMKDLIVINEERGGQFKQASIREWVFYKRRPWSIELSSYEGIIHPKKMTFIGGVPQGMLVNLFPSVCYYRSLNVEVRYIPGAAKGLEEESIVFSSLDRLGVEVPLWEGVFHSDRAYITVFSFFHRGSKVSFVRDKVKATVIKDLDALIPKIEGSITDIKVEFGHEIWVDRHRSLVRNNYKRRTSAVQLLDITQSTQKTLLRDVFYVGPYNDTPLGSLSSLMEVNELQQLI